MIGRSNKSNIVDKNNKIVDLDEQEEDKFGLNAQKNVTGSKNRNKSILKNKNNSNKQEEKKVGSGQENNNNRDTNR